MKISKILSLQLENKSLNHAYLIIGQDIETIYSEINKFLEKLNLTEPDKIISKLQETKKDISIEEARRIRHFLSLKPHSSPYKIAIIVEANKLSDQAQNALLKTLEEPSCNSILFLLSTTKNRILSTIASRCQFLRQDNIKLHVDPEKEKYLEKILNQDLSMKFKEAEKLAKEKNLQEVLENWLVILRQKLLAGQDLTTSIKKTIKAIRLLKTNVSQRLIIENLLLDI